MSEQDVFNLLDTIEDQIKTSDTIIADEKPSSYTAINNLRNDINNPPQVTSASNDKKEDIANLVECLTSITDNLKNFTSNDPIKITKGVLGVIGTIGSVVAGPYGPLVAAGCGLVSSILSLFGGGGPSLTEQLQEIIEQALEDFKDQEIYEQIIGGINDMRTLITELMGIARYNGGIMKDTEKSFLTAAEISLVANDILGVLQGQLDRYKTDNGDDSKSQSLATYTYYYAKICVYKTVLLNIHICLLRRNEMDSVGHAVTAYLNTELPSQGKGVLGFLSTLPDGKGVFYWRLYRWVHYKLDVVQRMVLTKYRDLIKLDPMPGHLCCLYHKYTKCYSYSSGTEKSSDYRYFFRWGPGDATYDSLFRLVDSPDGNKYIYNVFFGEYLSILQDSYDSDRRYVGTAKYGYVAEVGDFSWRIEGDDLTDDCTIRNEKYLEYLYSSGVSYDDKKYYNFTWLEGTLTSDAHWQIQAVDYATTLDLNTPMK